MEKKKYKCKLSTEQIASIIREYKDTEATYAQLAEKYGVSIAAIQYHIKGRGDKRINWNVKTNDKVIYPNIKRWLAQNGMRVPDAAKMFGLSYNTLYAVLIGVNDARKFTIDAILQGTGMTYEEAFAEDGE